MLKNFWVAVVVVFVAMNLFGYLIHHVMLGAEYQAVAHLYRSPEEFQAKMPAMWIATAIFAWAFVWIYDRGKEAKPFMVQGIRFGLIIACASVIPNFLVQYVVSPIGCPLVTKQIVFETIEMSILGVVVAKLRSA